MNDPKDFVSLNDNQFKPLFPGKGAPVPMPANSMMPEAYENGGKLAGVFTVLGFFVSTVMVVLENT